MNHNFSAPETTVLPFQRRSYEAKAFRWVSDSMDAVLSGTLDGFIDFALSSGMPRVGMGTHTLTCDEARALAAALLSAAEDVQACCLFDRDPLLVKG